MKVFWVIGGTYADTGFSRLEEGSSMERIGPFSNYDDAKKAWQKRAWETVDQANARYHIEEEGDGLKYWVVGGTYRDTSFFQTVAPSGEEWHGPFNDYQQAKSEWARLSWHHVDDALCRYRIERSQTSELVKLSKVPSPKD